MVEVLEAVDVIGLDIEHYQLRSFYGLVCTLQISTVGQGNFLIDALDAGVRCGLREHFGRVASNPDIIKVMHLDHNDTGWLQRDFGVFLVNVFHTGKAAEQVGLPLNFGELLEATFRVRLDKDCQTADWTQRPLPMRLAYYAVADAHYLLPVAAKLWGRLLELDDDGLLDDGRRRQPRLQSVCRAGKDACLPLIELRVPTVAHAQQPGQQIYPWSKDTNFKVKLKQWQNREPRDNRCITDLYLWRDSRCRELDEGVNHVCKTGILLELARQRPESAEAVAEVVGHEHEGGLGVAIELAQLIAQSATDPLEAAIALHVPHGVSDRPFAEADYSAAHCLIFDRDRKVTAVKSQKPNQSNPKYNDVGGKREPSESDPWETLVREAKEETGWDLNDISSFQVISSQTFPAAQSVAYLLVARNQTAPQPQHGDTVQDVLAFSLEEAGERLDYRGKHSVRAFSERVRWQSEFDEEAFWEAPPLSRLAARATGAPSNRDQVERLAVQQGEQQVAANHPTSPSIHYRYSKPGITMLAAQPLLLDAGWTAHPPIMLQQVSLLKLAHVAGLLFKAVHGRSPASSGRRWQHRLIRSVLVVPAWPSNDGKGEDPDPDKAAMRLVEHSTLRRVGCPNSMAERSCESVLAQSIYETKGQETQRYYISRHALAPMTAHTLTFKHETQGLVSYAGYIERQYQCMVDSEDRLLEVEHLPLVDGKPEMGNTKLVAGWTALFPNISRACVIAAGQAYQSFGFEQAQKVSSEDSMPPELYPLFVGNLSYSADDQQLCDYFPDAVQARVVRHPFGSSRGFGFVDFASENAARAALISAASQQFDGRTLNVDLARARQGHRNLITSTAAQGDLLCFTALSMGLSLGGTGIAVADMRSALQIGGFSELECGRWGKLGDAVVELAARHSIHNVDVARGRFSVPCSSCRRIRHLVGVATQNEELPGDCPYCHIHRRVSNDRLSSLYDSWIRQHSMSYDDLAGSRDEHTKGDCVEACFALVAYSVSLEDSLKLFTRVAPELRTDQDAVRPQCISLQTPTTAETVRELGEILLEAFGPANVLSRGTTADATWKWIKCVLIGEAVVNLCVLLFHFRSHPTASKDDLHRLQRTEPSMSVRTSSLAAAAERGGVMAWLASVQSKYTSENDDGVDNDGDTLIAAQSECWKAAVGALFLFHGGMDDDGSWDVGGGVIHRHLLSADKLPSVPRSGTAVVEPELDENSTEPEPEPEPELEPETIDVNSTRAEVLAAAHTNGDIFLTCNAALKGDKEIAMAAVRSSVDALLWASDALKEDKELLLAACKLNGRAIRYTDKLRSDVDVALAAVSEDGDALMFCGSAGLGTPKEKQIALAAVQQSGFALQYASEAMRDDLEVVRAAVEQAGNNKVLKCASAKVRAAILEQTQPEPEPEPEPELGREPDARLPAHPVDSGSSAGAGAGGSSAMTDAQPPQAPERSPLAQINCVCINCDSVLCTADLLHLNNNAWPPRLRMPQPTTLRLGEHPEEKQRKMGYGKAICISCNKDVGPTQGGYALLKARKTSKKPKVCFTRQSASGEQLKMTPQEFLAVYVSERRPSELERG